MESQPQNPEFRINPENFHPCVYGSREGSDESGHLARFVRDFAARLWDKSENLQVLHVIHWFPCYIHSFVYMCRNK